MIARNWGISGKVRSLSLSLSLSLVVVACGPDDPLEAESSSLSAIDAGAERGRRTRQGDGGGPVQTIQPSPTPGPHNIPGNEDAPAAPQTMRPEGGDVSLASVPSGWGPKTTDFYRDVPVQILGWYYYPYSCMKRTSNSQHAQIVRGSCSTGVGGYDSWVFRWKQGYELPPWNSPPTPAWWPNGPRFAVEATNAMGGLGKCFNIPNAYTHSGVDAQIYTCVGADNERHEYLDRPVGNRITWLHAGSYYSVCIDDPTDCQCWNQEPHPTNAFQQYACQNPPTSNEQWGFRYWQCNLNNDYCTYNSECCSGYCNLSLSPSKCTYNIY